MAYALAAERQAGRKESCLSDTGQSHSTFIHAELQALSGLSATHCVLTRLLWLLCLQGLKIRDARTAGADAYAGADEFDDTDY